MVQIQKASVEQIPQIKQLLKDTWLATYANIYSREAIKLVTSQWHSSEQLSRQINDPNSIFLVAKDNQHIVGLGHATIDTEKEVVTIRKLYISPKHQRQGIGSQLIEKLLKSLTDVSKADLEVEKQNHPAQNFYKKLGFSGAGLTSFVIEGVSIQCVKMTKYI